MNCNQIQKIIYSTKSDELSPAQEEIIKTHIAKCAECKDVFEKVQHADEILSRIKNQIPVLTNEEELTRSIVERINSKENFSPRGNVETFWNYLIELVSARTARLAFGLVLLFCVLSYTYMEYNDTKKIMNLEQKIDSRWNKNFTYASILQQENGLLNFLSNVYKFSEGSTSYLKLSKDWVVLKKEDLQALFNDYNKLDEATRKRLNEIRNQLPITVSSKFDSAVNDNEINSLRKEVERLNKELEKIKSQRGMK